MADYRVVTEGERTFVGTLNEDFAIESQIGQCVSTGQYVVADSVCARRRGDRSVTRMVRRRRCRSGWAKRPDGRRSCRPSFRICEMQMWERASESVEDADRAGCSRKPAPDDWAARQAANYVAAQGAAIGCDSQSQRHVVFERFFDESGGMQLVIHAPFGARINRAWGLALRKCFCRTFDFELQASADDNGIVLAIGPQQSFPLEQMFTLLDSTIARDVLIQALLAVPMFWCAVAMECDAGAGRVAAARRQESAAAFAAISGRRFVDRRVSDANGLFRASHGRLGAARSSARAANGSRLLA